MKLDVEDFFGEKVSTCVGQARACKVRFFHQFFQGPVRFEKRDAIFAWLIHFGANKARRVLGQVR